MNEHSLLETISDGQQLSYCKYSIGLLWWIDIMELAHRVGWLVGWLVVDSTEIAIRDTPTRKKPATMERRGTHLVGDLEQCGMTHTIAIVCHCLAVDIESAPHRWCWCHGYAVVGVGVIEVMHQVQHILHVQATWSVSRRRW
jgi:hypothetical protein